MTLKISKTLILLGFLVPKIWGVADLVAPFTVDLISSKHPLWDTIQITTYLSNIGTTATITKTSDFTAVSVGIDSLFPLKSHNIPASYFLNAGNTVYFKDTTIAFRAPFAITSQADPIHVFQEYSIGNDTRSQAYDFWPKIKQVHDTVVVYDTIKTTIHDTLRIHDTVKVAVHDTVVKKDTVKICPPTLAKAASLAEARPVASTVYNAMGTKVWEGMLPPGAYPPAGLRPGLHLIVQGQVARRFRIAYR